MNVDAFRTFMTLAELKNFTKTAQALYISQPSVSMHIRSLENELNTELFIRSPKKLQITPTGELLYERIKQLFSIYEQTVEDILEIQQSVQGKLSIGASFTVGEYIVPSLMKSMQSAYPEVEFDITIGNTDEIIQLVQQLDVDLGLIEGQTSSKDLHVEPFMEDELFIVAAPNHPLSKKETVMIDDLQDQVWISREEGSGTREYLSHLIRSNGLRPKSMLSISSNQAIKESIIEGMGLSLLSKHVCKRELEQNLLTKLPLEKEPFTRTFSSITSPLLVNKRNVEAFFREIENLEDR
ncbi:MULTISPECIES: LysR family transcriptional regulator [Allobacillus]|uniref:LysR family transcriptional regulator n=1 Tax=Allobacillus halotolerans TaxID=570278 RepID=A0ABS6GL58_9BACI|nr:MULTISPECIES: LysR family transcriptional regulator [Allobacillus]MBU6079889.1 LysR family transcriptional regulator [Allobacillus halotolerans]TSJ67876.1 LysR family transcriptional regulator [Allobacillus sp. SKP2-8]